MADSLRKLTALLRENLGLKIGAATGLAIFVIVLLLVGFFAAIQTPLISKFSVIQVLLVLAILMAGFSILVISICTNLLVQRPLNRLMSAIRRAERGDLKTRARVDSEDEIGQVATQFNEMLEKIADLEAMKIEADRNLTVAREELKFQKMLEEKAEIISSTNRRLEESLNELSVLYNISQAMTSSIDPDELCNQLGEVILKNVGVQDFAILLFNEETKLLEVKAARGFHQNDQIRGLRFALGEGVSGRVAQTRQAVFIPDTRKDKEYLHYKGEKHGDGSFLCLPILAKNSLLGAINFSRDTVNGFSQRDIHLLTTVANQIGIALENAYLYKKTRDMTLIDDLTQVHNRRHFHNMLEMECKRAKRFGRPLSLLMIDVDYFKKFNDTYGHVEGDRLLVELASILDNNLREVDTVARYGGEEFAVILPNTTGTDAEQVGQKLRGLVEKLTLRKRKEATAGVTVSVGVSTFSDDAQTMEDLIDHADIALYKAKAKGRNRLLAFRTSGGRPLRAVE